MECFLSKHGREGGGERGKGERRKAVGGFGGCFFFGFGGERGGLIEKLLGQKEERERGGPLLPLASVKGGASEKKKNISTPWL